MGFPLPFAFLPLVLISGMDHVSASVHTFDISAGTLNADHAATITMDGNVYLNDVQQIVGPNNTIVKIIYGNHTYETRTPLPGGDRGFPVGALIVATPGCGHRVPLQINVFYFPLNTAHGAPCGSGVVLENFLKSLPSGTPVAMTTEYNQLGWFQNNCTEDVKSWHNSVKMFGGKYTGTLGPTNYPEQFGPDYKSAYLLVGTVNGSSPVEKYCTSDFSPLRGSSAPSTPVCGKPFNGAWIMNVSVTLAGCSDPLLLV